LITVEELQEIRRIWVIEKHELEDNLPRIYQDATGEPYPAGCLDDNHVLGSEEMVELRRICADDEMHYELTRELLSIERQQRSQIRRAGLFERLEKAISRHFYDDREEAITTARERTAVRREIENGINFTSTESKSPEQASSESLPGLNV
jgi:DNA sulfur modification protein DndC